MISNWYQAESLEIESEAPFPEAAKKTWIQEWDKQRGTIEEDVCAGLAGTKRQRCNGTGMQEILGGFTIFSPPVILASNT
jgi:hypothetical protein